MWNDFNTSLHPQGSICQYDPATAIRENNLLTTLPFLGKEFEVSLDVLVSSFTVPNMEHGAYAEILRFTTTSNNCCKKGDRILTLFTKKGKYIHASTTIGENYNNAKNFGPFEVEKWLQVQARQFMDTETGNVDFQYYTLITSIIYFYFSTHLNGTLMDLLSILISIDL